MRHTRRVVVPTLTAVGKATLGVAFIVAFAAMFGMMGGDPTPSWRPFAVPLAVVALFGALEVAWFLRMAPRKVLFDEKGIEVHRRDGRVESLEWTALASGKRNPFTGRWDLARKGGTVLRLSGLGFRGEAWKDANARILDVLEGRGPPLAEGAGPAAGPEPPALEAPGTILAALGGAMGGAVLGAVAWGLLGGTTGYEIGYVAIGVGFLVGTGAKILGSRGAAMGWACAVLALFSILTGKGIACGMWIEKRIAQEQARVDRALYDRITSDASDWSRMEAGHDREFMASHGLSASTDPAKVTEEEVRAFQAGTAPFLEQWRRMPPRFEAWQETTRESIRAGTYAQVSFAKAIGSTLGPLDILFAILGAGAALRIGGGPVARRPPRPGRRFEGSRSRRGGAAAAPDAAPAVPVDLPSPAPPAPPPAPPPPP